MPSDKKKVNKKGEEEGVRAYVVDVLTSLHSHTDVQCSDGKGMLLKYVSGYVPKFSDSFTIEWLNDHCSDYMVARRVLTDYHPLEPEMILQLAMQWFPQVFAGGTMQRFVVPAPWIENDLPERVKQYMACTWRPEHMTLSDFLRRSNLQGHIHKSFKRRYAKAQAEENVEGNLESWVANAHAVGHVMTAAIYLSRYNDKYYGQWVLMNVPFRKLDDLLRPELQVLPPHLYYQGLALLHRPDQWRDPEAIRRDLELEAFREHHIRNIIAMLTANSLLIDKYLDGSLEKEQVSDENPGVEQVAEWLPEQLRLAAEIVESVKKGVCVF